MANFYLDETCYQSKFYKLICELLKKDVKMIKLNDGSSNDGTLGLDFYLYSILYFLIEIKIKLKLKNMI